jgi:protein-S-isoprenylcysteine O-methyltransferase Ste14
MRTETDNAGVIAPPPILYGAAFIIGVILNWARPALVGPPAIALSAGIVLLLAGGVLATWANRTLRKAGTSCDPRRATTTLVVSGPFRFSRNPSYLARTLLYVGLALFLNTLWPLASLLPLMVILHYGVIRREENYLSVKFGAVYRQYQASVSRWL